jgi:hypothetical protein
VQLENSNSNTNDTASILIASTTSFAVLDAFEVIVIMSDSSEKSENNPFKKMSWILRMMIYAQRDSWTSQLSSALEVVDSRQTMSSKERSHSLLSICRLRHTVNTKQPNKMMT